jgi:hypothetical protein
MMRFDHHDQRAVRAVTANVVPMVLLAAKANLAVIDLRAMVLPATGRRVTAKDDRHEKVRGDHRVMEKADLPKVATRDVDANKDEAMVLRARGLRAVPWDHRIQNASWKMRCVSMPTLMAN